MKAFALLIGTIAAVVVRKDDLSYERDADKVDPLSRYVNDEDIVQLHDTVPVILAQKDDLSYERDADKVDPLSRYVNDEDI